MPPTAKIPVPTDNYDAPHALVESLTSLRAMAVAVDVALDALEDSVKAQSSRVDLLTERAEAYRTQVERLAAEGQGGRHACTSREGESDKGEAVSCLPQETAPPLRLELPASYDRAIGKEQEDNQSSTNNAQDAANIVHASVMAKAREAAHKAVREVLRRDRELDDGQAVLSDAWLDRQTAFDEAAECAAAVESMTVPSLRQQTLSIADEVTWYEQEAADAAEAAASSLGVGSSTAKSSSEGEYDYDDMASVRTGMSLSSRMTATTIGADGVSVGGAVERRRQRQQAQLERKRRQWRREQQQQQQQQQEQGGAGGTAGAGFGSTDSAAAAAQAAVEDIFDRASAVRQQVLSGSLPYLADVLHDAYGCENGSKPKTADELVAFSSIPPPSSRVNAGVKD